MGVGRRVRGEGPTPARIMCIGEWPNRDDARSGRVFSAKRGRENEIDRYLSGINLPSRHECYMTYWVKEWCGDEGEYTDEDFARDLPTLHDELIAAQPELVITLGKRVTQYFLGDVDMEMCHGIQWILPTNRCIAGQTETMPMVIFPTYSPAASFRSPELSAAITYDFLQLESYESGELQPRVLFDDPIPHPIYTELTDPLLLDTLMRESPVLSVDTEGWAWAPWSVQLTDEAGGAYIIRYKNRPMINRLVKWIDARGTSLRFIFHNSLHDLDVFRSLGVNTTNLIFDDTMIMAYNLQLEPQGLKPLCARWCGMSMMHYEDVMGDASARIAQDWLLMVVENEDEAYKIRCTVEFDRLTTTPYLDKRGKTQPGRKLRVHPKLPRTALHKSIERCLRSAHPRKLWADQLIDRHVEAHTPYGDIWIATLDHVPLDRAIQYAGRDSDGTHRLYPALTERLRSNALWDVYQSDVGTVPLIDRMQRIGIKPDLEHFVRLSTDLAGELHLVLQRIRERIGRAASVVRDRAGYDPDAGDDDESDEFNPNSTDQVGELLFERFGIQSLKRTPGGNPSTNDKVLEALEKDVRIEGYVRELVADIREYREIYKLKFTFVDQIPEFTHRWPFDRRIHATFRITRVVTGRLAASNPNLLALPKHGKFAKRFRQGFIADHGHTICSWDLSQIELRVLAHLSQDPVLLHAFRNGIDLHATLAQRIFGVAPKDQDDSKHRLPAKAVNFGIPMGMTNIGLCLELRKNGIDVDEQDAQRWLDETMALYSQVGPYQQGKIAEARRYGFVTDIRGRRRYIGGMRAFDEMVRAEAERFAFATPIQAGAQSIMKRAEKYLYTDVLVPRWKNGQWVEPLIQVHDDLVLEAEGSFTQYPHPTKPGKHIAVPSDVTLHQEVVYAMTQVPASDLSVPIETSGSIGFNWGSMHEIRESA